MKCLLNFTFLLIFLALFGCDSNDGIGTEPESEIAEIRISPADAVINVEEQVDFDFVVLTELGDTVRNANLEVNWWSTDPTVFTVEDGGTATAVQEGTAYCMVEATELGKLALFTGKDSAFVTVQLF